LRGLLDRRNQLAFFHRLSEEDLCPGNVALEKINATLR
jgi:hypothetical protein